MRLLLTILFVGIFCQAGSDLSANNIKPNYPLPKLDNNHNVESDTIKSILIIGDSQSTITTSSGKKINWTWPVLLQNSLDSCDVKIDVLAYSGKTSSWMLKNGTKKLNSGHWDMVIIYGGGNDATNKSIPLDTIISNFQKLIDVANDNGSKVMVNLGWKIEGRFMNINVLPVGRPSNLLKRREDWKPYIQRRKDLQVLLKERLTGCSFIGPYDLMSRTGDGIHPSASGHQLVSEYVLESIDSCTCK